MPHARPHALANCARAGERRVADSRAGDRRVADSRAVDRRVADSRARRRWFLYVSPLWFTFLLAMPSMAQSDDVDREEARADTVADHEQWVPRAKTTGPARDGLDAARTALVDLEFAVAAHAIDGVLARPDMTEAEAVEAHFLGGVVNRILERDTQARLHFLSALQKRPTLALPETAPPKVVTFLEMVRAEFQLAESERATKVAPKPNPPVDDVEQAKLPVTAPAAFPWVWLGAGVATAGLVGVVLAGGGTYAALGVVDDPTSSGQAKEGAFNVVALCFAGGAVALVTVIGGITLATVGGFE